MPAAAQATYKRAYSAVEDPGPQTERSRPDQGCFKGAVSRPKVAALPAEKHMANHQHVDGHALWRYDMLTRCKATMNFSTSSSESQSIKHTSPHNCIHDTETSMFAETVPWTTLLHLCVRLAAGRPARLSILLDA